MAGKRNIFNRDRIDIGNRQFLTLRPDNLGILVRSRPNDYDEIITTKSIYMQSNNITPVERSIGMPVSSNDNIFIRLTTPSNLQITSTSVNDTSAGTGAQTIYIEGLIKINNSWIEATESFTMNGQTPVVSTIDNWWRVNKIWVNTSGSSEVNEGDIYVSPSGATTTAGIPAIGNTICAVIQGYSNSTSGTYSVGSNRLFQYTKGNFWIDPTKPIRVHEFFYQDFSGGDDLTKYEVGEIYA